MRIDLSEVRNVLASVDRLLVEHHDEELHNPRGQRVLTRRGDDKMALLADDLRAIQDYLQLAVAEVANVYWVANGREDPRTKRNHRWPLAQPPRDTNSRRGTSPRYLDERWQPRPSLPVATGDGR